MKLVCGERIKQARQIRGLSIERMAEMIHQTPHKLKRFESNLEQPLVETLERIAIVLSWPIAFFRQGPPPDFPMGSLLFHELAADKENEHTEVCVGCLASNAGVGRCRTHEPIQRSMKHGVVKT